MSAVANLLTSANANATDLVGEWMPGILVRQGKSANFGSVLLGFFAKLKAEAALNGAYNWWERDPVRSNFYSHEVNNTTDTTMQFDDGQATPAAVAALLATGTILLNGRTGEYIQVAADPSTNTTTTDVTVVRNCFGDGATGTATVVGDCWSRITEGAVEGSAPRRAAYDSPSNYQNLIQTFKSTAYLSNYYAAGQVRTNMEGPKQDAKVYALEQIVNQIEKAFLFGQKSTGISGVQYTGGVTNGIDLAITADSNLAANKLTGNGSAGNTLNSLLDWLRAFMLNGSEAKLLMCGPNSYSALSTFANSAAAGFRIMNDNGQVFGLNLTEIQTPFGKASLALHPLMKNDINLQSSIVAVDLGLVKMKVMEKLHYQEFEPTNGTDAYQGQFRAKLGIMQQFAAAFGYATNFSQINP